MRYWYWISDNGVINFRLQYYIASIIKIDYKKIEIHVACISTMNIDRGVLVDLIQLSFSNHIILFVVSHETPQHIFNKQFVYNLVLLHIFLAFHENLE